jgi:hypothetical protein
VRTIKLFAVIGLAVALVGVWAVSVMAADKVVTITCQNNKIGTVNPEKVDARVGDTLQWTISTTGCPPTLAGGRIEIRFPDKSPFGETSADKVVSTAVSSPMPQSVTTDKKEIKIAGQYDYDIVFLDKDNRELDKKSLKAAVIVVVPTLTEWGLIALAVLLAGGMGYMIYRRRPALRPAAP